MKNSSAVALFARATLAALGIAALSAGTAPPAFAQSGPTAAPSAGAATAGTTVTVPDGTAVDVVVLDKISSATAKKGDVFGIRAVKDVVVDGHVVIAKDAVGEGEVVSVQPAGVGGHAGSLGVRCTWLYSVGGDKTPLRSEKSNDRGSNRKAASMALTWLSSTWIGPLSLFAHNFVKGGDVQVDGSRTFQAFVDGNVAVTTTSAAAPSPAPAH